MSWETPSEIVKEFGLKADPSDVAAIVAELRQQVVELHPDRTGGKFPNSVTEKHFHRLSEAISHLESAALVPGGSLELVRRFESIERVVAGLSDRLSEGIAPELSKTKREVAAEAVAGYRKGRFQSAGFAAVCASIVGFSQVLRDNPVFGWVVESKIALATLVAAFAVSAAFFIANWIKEERITRRTDWLLTEPGLRYTTRGCLQSSLHHSGEAHITKSGLVNQVALLHFVWHRRPVVRKAKDFFVAKIPASQAEQIANLQIAELLKRGLLERSGTVGIEPRFTMPEASVKELLEDHVGSGYDFD